MLVRKLFKLLYLSRKCLDVYLEQLFKQLYNMPKMKNKIRSPCRTTGHFLLLVFDDFESSLTILSLVHLVFIMGSSPLDMSLKRVLAMDYNSF